MHGATKKISIFERMVLRSIGGPTRVNGGWRIRYGDEMYYSCNEAAVIQKIKGT
jgi:hypothetical protein